MQSTQHSAYIIITSFVQKDCPETCCYVVYVCVCVYWELQNQIPHSPGWVVIVKIDSIRQQALFISLFAPPVAD